MREIVVTTRKKYIISISPLVSYTNKIQKSAQNIAKFKRIPKVYILNESKNFADKSYWICCPDWRLYFSNFERGFEDSLFELEPTFPGRKCGMSWDLSIPQVSAPNWILDKMLPEYLLCSSIVTTFEEVSLSTAMPSSAIRFATWSLMQ